MVRVSHDHHSSGPWSLKDRADSVVSSGTRGRTVSTRILGIGIALVGVLFLAVGLIMGLEFPGYVHKQNKEKQCVVYPGHEKYTSWSQGSQWTRKVSAYYWTLVNANDFLYRGNKPQFVQKGPYMYTETETKYGVNFALTEVSFRLRRDYEFDKEATDLACSNCDEGDQLTIISPWYLQTVGQHGGEEALGWTYIPVYTITYMYAAGLVQQEYGENVFNQNISILGSYTTGLASLSNEPLVNFSFGAWLHSSTGSYRSTIESNRVGYAFTLSETTALYRVLTNVTLLGGKALSQSDQTLQQKCMKWAYRQCSYWTFRTTIDVGVAECGVIYIFKKCQRNITSEALNILQQTFCPSSIMNACLNLTGLPEDLLVAYENAISDFLWHISALVFQNVLASKNLSLVISRNQSQLALGYDVRGDNVNQEYHVTGLLQSNWIGDASGTAPLWKVYTCLENRNMDNNMKIKEYRKSWSFLGGDVTEADQASMSSFTDFVTSCAQLNTCQTCSSPGPGSSLRFFIEGLVRATPFLFNSSATMNGVSVLRYDLDANAFRDSSKLNIASGLQNMSDIVGYLSWASLPQVTGGLFDHVIMDTSPAPSNSYVLIEPITGRVWERSIKLQWSLGISSETARVQGRNITVAGLPLPLIWTERTAFITNYEINAHKYLVSRLMAVSCGGVIGFSVIATIIVVVGIVVCVYPAKPNRITPLMEDSTNSMSNGRHL